MGVVLPRDETDLALVLDVARDAQAAILPRGADWREIPAHDAGRLSATPR